MKITEGVELDLKAFREQSGIVPRLPGLTEGAEDYLERVASAIEKRLGEGWHRSHSQPEPTFHHNEYYFVVKRPDEDNIFLITQVGNYQTFPIDGSSPDSIAARVLRKVHQDIPLRDEAWSE